MKALIAWGKAGINIYTPPKDELARLKEVGVTVWGKWKAEKEAKGLPARKIVEKVKKPAAEYK